MEQTKEAVYLINDDKYLHLRENGAGVGFATYNKVTGEPLESGQISEKNLPPDGRNAISAARNWYLFELSDDDRKVIQQESVKILENIPQAGIGRRRIWEPETLPKDIRLINSHYDDLYRIPIFEDKQVEYDIDIPEQPVRVRLDMDSYMRIVNNLIQNVIAHSHADKIKIVLSKKENNMELLLADNGVGIEKEDLKHIFERLYKCDKGRSEKGSGLGLSIVHQLVEKMGGSITVESLPGKGTECRSCRLPAGGRHAVLHPCPDTEPHRSHA